MPFNAIQHAVLAAALAAATPAFAAAAAADYRFEAIGSQPAGAGKTGVTVRLVHLPDDKPVPGAVIFETHADMGPEGMPTMPGDVAAGAALPGGAYRFEVATAMPGQWALALSAKVQGEPQTVKGFVTFKAVK